MRLAVSESTFVDKKEFHEILKEKLGLNKEPAAKAGGAPAAATADAGAEA